MLGSQCFCVYKGSPKFGSHTICFGLLRYTTWLSKFEHTLFKHLRIGVPTRVVVTGEWNADCNGPEEDRNTTPTN